MLFFKTLSRSAVLVGCAVLLLAGCDAFTLDEEPDPNGPSIQDIVDNPTAGKIINLATGVEAGMRTDINLYLTDVSTIGREVYRFSASDPRFTADLLGAGTAVLDNNTFYITRPWAERYRVVRNANILIEALGNTPDAAFSPAERAAIRGYAQTIIGYQLLLNANLTFQNGLRVDVAGDEPGPLVDYGQGLSAIASTLNDAQSQLDQAGETLPFGLSEGFSGFDTPAGLSQVNRALAARVAAYESDFPRVLTLLEDSFIDTGAPLSEGVYHAFSTAPGDQVNPWFINPQQSGELIAAQPDFVEDIARDDAGTIIDERFSKVVQREDTFEQVGLRSEWGFFVYKTQTSPIPIIRNGELILLRAEARIQTGALNDAVADLNVIRNAAGLPDYDGPVTEAALTDEMLRQRRYELYGEGHRWIDMRRYDRLDELPTDRPEDDVWTQFPIPANENVGS